MNTPTSYDFCSTMSPKLVKVFQNMTKKYTHVYRDRFASLINELSLFNLQCSLYKIS